MTASASARKKPADPEGDGTPQLVALRSVPDRETERVPLFTIDDTPYYIAKSVPANKALRYMHIGRTQGLEAQIDFMLGVLLGEEGYEALMGFDDLTEANLLDVIKACQKVMTGAVEAPKGKSKSG